MRYSLLLSIFPIFILLCALNCSEEKGGILSLRDLTKMESRLVGKWEWTDNLEKDIVEFKNNLSYEGTMSGNNYTGSFAAGNDSILVLSGRVLLNGGEFVQNYQYRILEVNNTRLCLQSTSRVLVYNRAN